MLSALLQLHLTTRFLPLSLNSLDLAGFEIVECKTSSNYLECLAQLKNVYWKEEIKPRTIFGKIICEFQIVKNNLSGSIIGKIMPISDKMYLDNVMVVRKISS